MPLVKIKICGITNVEDALAAVDMGADLLGFNFYPKSPRYIELGEALKIVDKLPTFVDTVGIFVNATFEQIKTVEEHGFLNWVQLHGDETPKFCDSLRWFHFRTMKAIRVKSAEDMAKVNDYYTDAVLLDAFDPERYGGTGHAFDWSVIGNLHKRVFLAGGITPESASAAIEVGVYGIDICSGVESAPGKKDHAKMKRLFENVKHLTC